MSTYYVIIQIGTCYSHDILPLYKIWTDLLKLFISYWRNIPTLQNIWTVLSLTVFLLVKLVNSIAQGVELGGGFGFFLPFSFFSTSSSFLCSSSSSCSLHSHVSTASTTSMSSYLTCSSRMAFLQYFTVPLPFLQESSGIHRNGTGIHRNPQESAGMGPESSGMRLEWNWNWVKRD